MKQYRLVFLVIENLIKDTHNNFLAISTGHMGVRNSTCAHRQWLNPLQPCILLHILYLWAICQSYQLHGTDFNQ